MKVRQQPGPRGDFDFQPPLLNIPVQVKKSLVGQLCTMRSMDTYEDGDSGDGTMDPQDLPGDQDYDGDGAISPEDLLADEESVSALVSRLQTGEICMQPVKIFLSRNTAVQPAIVERSALCGVSAYFRACFDPKNRFAKFKEADEEGQECSFTFADYTPDTIKVFLYWLSKDMVPGRSEMDNFPPSSYYNSEWQLLLARAYAFAEDKRIPTMQNDVIRPLLLTFIDTELDLEMLQKILNLAQRQSMLRLAVLEEALHLEHDGSELLEGLEKKWVCGIEVDMREAKVRFDRRHRARGTAEDYLVKVGSGQ